jgi:uncharacterized protein YehS (DUF1456 family)
MINNDVLRSIRYMLSLNEQKMLHICELGGYPVKNSDMVSYLKREEEDGYAECSDEFMSHFLNGLIYFKRGKDESRPAPEVSQKMTNNIILKKLRVAFEMKDVDMYAVLEQAGFPITKTELSAFFRNENHRNYRECGDQVLRNFLKGLTMRVRK